MTYDLRGMFDLVASHHRFIKSNCNGKIKKLKYFVFLKSASSALYAGAYTSEDDAVYSQVKTYNLFQFIRKSDFKLFNFLILRIG